MTVHKFEAGEVVGARGSTNMANSTTNTMAREVVRSAREAGASWTMLREWQMEAGDCEYVRSEWPRLDREESRQLIGEVEAAVRQYGDEGLSVERTLMTHCRKRIR